MRILTVTICVGALVAAPSAGAQTLESSVSRAPDGVVRIQVESRTGVCGDGRDVVGYRSAIFARNFQSMGGHWSESRCRPGPLLVTLTVDHGEVTQLRTQVGGSWPTSGGRVTDLGVVPPSEASAYFFSLVPKLETASGKDRLLIPAVLADDVPVLQPLFAIARDQARAIHTRRAAVQWLGLLGDKSVVPTLVQFASDDVDDEGNDKPGNKSIGSTAMAALSMLDADEGVPALIELSRGGGVGTRRNAVFWLAQNGDPRGLRVLHGVIQNEREDRRVRQHAIFSLANNSERPQSEFSWLRGIYATLDDNRLKEAVFQGMQQDEGDGGRWLLDRALDTREPTSLRKTALFWAGQRDATPTLELVRVYRESREASLKEHAIFVLSQRRDDVATDELLRIAREDGDREMRGKALFWLGQKDDPRVRKFIADLILK